MKTIYLVEGSKVIGPFNDSEIKEGLKSGKWHGRIFAWRPGMKKWAPLARMEMDRTTVGATFASEPPPAPSLLERQNKTMLFTALASLVLFYIWFAGMRGKPTTTTVSNPQSVGTFGSVPVDVALSPADPKTVEGERMEAVFFEQNNDQLSPSAADSVVRIGQLLQTSDYRKSRVITIVGYASSEGDLAQNENLSKSRAVAVKKRLVEMGIDAGKIVILPGGQANKAAENDPNPKMNRRVEIYIGR
jgi:outer membrane protein OmpA-like peptidoglycan-associated protein